MTNQQGAPEALRLADELDAEAGRITQYTNRPGDLLRELAADELRRMHSEVTTLQAELAAMRAGGEPVMWAFQHSDGSWNHGSGTEHSAGMKPLYAHPQPAAQDAERKPLTDEQAHQLLLGMEAYINTFDEDSVTAVQLSGEAVRFIVGKVAAIAAQQGEKS